MSQDALDDAREKPREPKRQDVLPARDICQAPASLFQEAPPPTPGSGGILLSNPGARSTRVVHGMFRKARRSFGAVGLPARGPASQATGEIRVPCRAARLLAVQWNAAARPANGRSHL